ncbi:MAG: TetR/AcrR family transcriptional regulator [Kofleriaceae bacterium]
MSSIKRALQKQETERSVLDAALSLFTTRGYEATTTKHIAEAAGVAHGTVFLVAATKEALLVRVLEDRLRAEVARRTESLPKRGITARLVHVFDGLFDFYAAHPELSRVFLRAIMLPADAAARIHHDEHVSRFVTYLGSLFGTAIARSELPRRTNVAVAASSVFAIYVTAIVTFLAETTPDRRALDARFRAGLDLIIRGLRAATRSDR